MSFGILPDASHHRHVDRRPIILMPIDAPLIPLAFYLDTSLSALGRLLLSQISDNDDASRTACSGDHNNNNNDGISHTSKQQKGDAMDLV